jgi:hypothetical protein
MKDHPFQGWLEKAANHSGILACGVRLANQSIAVKSFDPSFPEARLGDFLQCLTEVTFGLRNSQLGGSRLRWVFEHGQLYSVRRQDGALAVLAMSKDHNATLAIEELFAEFLATIRVGPAKPGVSLPEETEPGAAPDSESESGGLNQKALDEERD